MMLLDGYVKHSANIVINSLIKREKNMVVYR